MALSPINEILEDLRAGRVVILVDDESRENEGDFMCAAEFITPKIVNFMTRIGGGYLCVALDGDSCDRLNLVPQSTTNSSLRGTPMTVSVDGSPHHGVGTGVSASDRTKTIQLLAEANSSPGDFVRPGHINPLRARDGGALVRTGQTEGSVDLCKLAGLRPAAVIIEIVKPDGDMARMLDLEELCVEHDIKMCSVEQVIAWRLERETLVSRIDPVDGAMIETAEGSFRLFAWQSSIDALPHLALTMGGVGDCDDNGEVLVQEDPVLVRMHRRDLLGDIFRVPRDAGKRASGDDLHAALRAISTAGRGAVVYLRTESGMGELSARLQRIQRRETDDVNAPDLTRDDSIAGRTHPMDRRELGIGSQILRDLGIRTIRLLSNSPARSMPGLSAFDLEIVEQLTFEE